MTECYFCKTDMGEKEAEPGMVWACSDCCDNYGIMPGAFDNGAEVKRGL